MQRRNLAVPVKLWALLWTIMGISLTGNAMLTCSRRLDFSIWPYRKTGGCWGALLCSTEAWHCCCI